MTVRSRDVTGSRYSAAVERYAAAEAAERAGVSVEELGRMVELGLFAPDPAGLFGAGDIRRARLHAGPVIFQESDYHGQTVNIASRNAEYARPGEVLVGQEVVDAAGGSEVGFREIGPVELKGVAGAVRLHAAYLPG